VNQTHVHRPLFAVIPVAVALAAVLLLAAWLSSADLSRLPFIGDSEANSGVMTTSITKEAREQALTASVTAHGASEHNPAIGQMLAGSSRITNQLISHSASERADRLGH
jgi:hypothetical protein